MEKNKGRKRNMPDNIGSTSDDSSSSSGSSILQISLKNAENLIMCKPRITDNGTEEIKTKMVISDDDTPIGSSSGSSRLSSIEESSGDEELSLPEDEYVVDAIVNHRFNENGLIEYQVKWMGYPYDEMTWEPIENLDSCKLALKNYEKSGGAKKKLKGSEGDTQSECSEYEWPAGVYIGESIVDKRVYDNGQIEYQVKWVGRDELTWEPLQILTECKTLIADYEELPKPKQEGRRLIIRNAGRQRRSTNKPSEASATYSNKDLEPDHKIGSTNGMELICKIKSLGNRANENKKELVFVKNEEVKSSKIFIVYFQEKSNWRPAEH